mgnify:CR=1 FL=1
MEFINQEGEVKNLKKDKLYTLFLVFLVLLIDKIKMGKYIIVVIVTASLISTLYEIYLLLMKNPNSLNKYFKNKLDSIYKYINDKVVENKEYYILKSEKGFLIISIMISYLTIFVPKVNIYYLMAIPYVLIILSVFNILSIYIYNSNIKLPHSLKFITRIAEKKLHDDGKAIYIINLVKYAAFELFLTIVSILRLL